MPTLAPTQFLQKGLCICLFILLCISGLAQPTISSFSPASGPAGTSVTLTGTNFSPTPANNIVHIGAVKANVTAATTTALTVTIPAGATFQPISVTTNSLTAYSNKPFIVTFSGAAPLFTSQSFAYAGGVDDVNSSVETTKYTIGDIDDDGRVDVITVDRLNNTLSVYRNITAGGDISFASRVDFTTGQSPRAVATADVDGDGKPDVVVTNRSANTVSVFKNTTSGGVISLASKVDFSTATQPSGIAVTDIDKDGKPDLVINTINLEGYVSVLRNTSSGGTISFASRTDLQSVGGSIEEIRTADVDGDGKEDVVVPNYGLNRITIFRNTSTAGSVSFAGKIDIATNGQPDHVEISDLNGDGMADLAVTSYLTGYDVSVFRNTSSTGAISFSYTADFSTGGYTNGMTLDDLDGSGKPDIVVGTGSEFVALFKNATVSGTGITFNEIKKFASPWNSQILTADFDNDGKTDISFESGALRVTIWKNKTTSPQLVSFSPVTAGAGAAITIHGFNLTGVTSVSFGGVPAASFTVVNESTINAVVGSGASGAVTIAAPHGTNSLEGFTYVPAPLIASFTPVTGSNGQTVTISGSNFSGATAVSFGGVPAASFTVVNETTINAVVGSGASGDVSVTTTGGTAILGGFTFIPPPDVISFSPTSGISGTTVIITGTNFNGVSDVRFGGIPAGSFTVLSPTSISAVVLGGSSGYVKVTVLGIADSLAGFTFISPPPPVITSVSPESGPVGTLVTIAGNNFHTDPALNHVYFGPAKATVKSASTNTLTVEVPPGAAYGSVSVTANFLTAVSLKPFIPTFSGGGGISSNSFSEYSIFPSDWPLGDICIADFDADGRNDLAATNTWYSISVFRNNSVSGSISFEPNVDYDANSTLIHIETAEIDGDGKKDIVAFGNSLKKLFIFKNTSSTGSIDFADSKVYPMANDVSNFTIADMDNDGKQDIVLVRSSFVSIIRNASVVNHILLGSQVDIPVGVGSLIKMGDVDGDGKLDIVWLSGDTDSIYILRNTGDGNTLSFAPAVVFPSLSENPYYFGSTGFFIGDLDNDSKPEIAIANTESSHSVSVLKNNSTPGTIAFPERKDLMTGDIAPYDVVAEDLDGDGKPDLAFSHEYVPRAVCAIKNNSTSGSLSFSAFQNYTDGSNGSLGSIRTGDLNNDGRPEIISAGEPGIYVFKNNTNGPHINSFSPPNGIAGEVITLTGANLTGTTEVSFGGVPASSFTVESATTITAVLGAGAEGDITVTTPKGSASAPGFLYGLLPTISSFTPTSGVTGTTITITGTNFTGATEVRLGGVSSTPSFTVNSDIMITAIVGAGASGNVSVKGPGGTASIPGFTYIPPPPVITSFSPQTGPQGTLVYISGSDFHEVTAVSFGDVPAESFTVYSTSLLTAIVGTGATGNVSVVAAGGTDSKGGFIFVPPLPLPTITAFSPGSGNSGTEVTITGTHFSGATAVSFGGVPASSFTVNSDTKITAFIGSGESGDVTVTTPAGTATIGGFIYNTVTAIDNPENANTRKLTVSYNPAYDVLTIGHPASEKNAKLWFVDILGRKVGAIDPQQNSTRTETGVNNLTPGIYIIIWSDGISKLSRIISVQ